MGVAAACLGPGALPAPEVLGDNLQSLHLFVILSFCTQKTPKLKLTILRCVLWQ